MAQVLFIKANPRPIEAAVSVKLYHAFLDSYRAAHPEDEIIELDLYKENLPYYDNTKITALFKQGRGMELTAEEQEAADLVNRYLDQFIAADKVVIGFPLWNFTVPAALHTYIDYLSQAGKTFRYTPEGPIGLMSDKKVALLNARGGVYSDEPMASIEMSFRFISAALGFWGITNITSVIVEGHNQYPDKAAELVETGVAKAKAEAAGF